MEIEKIKVINQHMKEVILHQKYDLTDLDKITWSKSLDQVFSYGNPNAILGYYKKFTKRFGEKSRIGSSHAMTTERASQVNREGHDLEQILAEEYGLSVTSNNYLKTDTLKDGKPYASIKKGSRTQWGLHVLNSIPDSIALLLGEWLNSHVQENCPSYLLEAHARIAVNLLSNLQNKRDFYEWWLTKNEETKFMIIWEDKMPSPIQIKTSDFITTLVNHTEVGMSYSNKNGFGNKIIFKSEIPNKGKSKKLRKINIMEFEYRKDKGAFLLVSTLENIVRFIYHYNINLVEIGTDEIN